MSKRFFFKKNVFPPSLFFLILLTGFQGLLAAADGSIMGESRGPISITASKMVVQSLEDKITFEGRVLIKRGDLKIEADLAEVFLKNKEAGSSLEPSSSLLLGGASQKGKEVSEIMMSGGVDIQQGDRRAKAKKGLYSKEKEKITLTGHPEVWENDIHIKGKTITLFLAENRTLVSESELVIRPESGRLEMDMK